jgi:Uma2 family endonuclease
MRAVVKRRPFTTEEYHRLLQAGILREDDRVELIEGEILEMSPIGSRHAAAVKRLDHGFSSSALLKGTGPSSGCRTPSALAPDASPSRT